VRSWQISTWWLEFRSRHPEPDRRPTVDAQALNLDSDLWLLAAVPITGVLAGFINTLAGSGSLITLPILILLGLPANVANGTNRVGVVVQNIVAVATFRRHGAFDSRGLWPLVIASVVGSVLGANLAVDLDERLLRQMIGVLMLVMIGVMFVQPERWLAEHQEPRKSRPWLELPLYFVIGIYGGFLQAGVGVFLLAALVLGSGFNLVTANAAKNLFVLVFTAAALVVFIAHDQVNWMLGLLLAAGQAVGAWIAVKMTVRRGAKFVRWVVIAVIIVSSAALLTGIG
jgi:uncharacterized protein